jgi:hypothetical protein
MHIGHNILLIRKDKCHVDNKNENREELNEWNHVKGKEGKENWKRENKYEGNTARRISNGLRKGQRKIICERCNVW